MMKTSIISVCLLLATGAMAQQMPQGKNLIGKQQGDKLEKSRLFTKALMSKPHTANKSTATYERMSAMSEYVQNQQSQIVMVDSLVFNYSGMNGSQFDFNSMTIGYFDPIFGAMTPQNFLTFYPDNFQVYNPALVGNYTFVYDVNDYLVEIYMEPNSGNDERYLFTYSNSMVVRADNLEANGPNWDTTYRRYFYYDVNDMLVEDSLMENQNNVWSVYRTCEYTNDINGNLISLKVNDKNNMNNVFQPYGEDHYTYDVNNRLQTATYAYYNELTTNMDMNYKDSFEFTTGFDFYTKDNYYEWDEQNMEWLPTGYVERTLNTQMLPQTASTFDWDGTGFVPLMERYYTYNTAGNPTHDSLFGFTNGVLDEDPFYIAHYYYEEYGELGVDRTTTKAAVSVYPNPVSDILTVSNGTNEVMNLQIVNALGQTVKKARTIGQGKLSIGDLTQGMYWLTVTDAKGNKLHQQAIVKQ